MACPFKHLWPADVSTAAGPAGGEAAAATQAADIPLQSHAVPAASEAPGKCPFNHAAAAPAAAGSSASRPPPAGQAGGGSVRGAHATAAASITSGAGQRLDAGELQPPTPVTAADAAAAAGQCPFLAGVGGMTLQAPSAAAAAAHSPAAGDGSGAAGHAAAANEQAGLQPGQMRDRQQQQSGASAGPAVCPLGFGSSQQPKLGEFNCLICRSLYFYCGVTSCGHRYCSGCIRGSRDCPICGADITSLTPDEATQALVDKYIDAHAGNHTIWELEGSAGEQVEGMAGERSSASFFLQLGLRAIAAGNIDSARHRFLRCQQELQQQQQAQQEGGTPADLAPLQCRLGAVSGCLGDCCRAVGDVDGTLHHYQQSVQLLQAAGCNPEAQQALSVALNKVGELHHLQGDLPAAAELYAQALQLRRSLLAATRQQWQGSDGSGGDDAGGQQSAHGSAETAAQVAAGPAAAAAAEGDEACCSAALDLAASCIKLAGARHGMGASGEAETLLGEAGAVLSRLEAGLARQPPRLQRKHSSLAQFAQMMVVG